MKRLRILLRTCFLTLCIIVVCGALPRQAAAQDTQALMLKKVVIDAGHGGRDPGALGTKSKEKDIVLDIALRLGKMIREKYRDVEVIYTRNKDVFVELDKRGDIANKAHANLFISIHANANKETTPYGTETFVMGTSKSEENMEVAQRENEVILIEDDYSSRYAGFDPSSPESHIYFSLFQNSYINQSIDFAGEVQQQFRGAAGRYDRGVKQANFWVLWRTAMPSVLIEVGFITHPEEERFMRSASGKEKLAKSIFEAFCSYKTKVEERSAFRTGEQTASIDTPAVDSASAMQGQRAGGQRVEFGVQIGSSSKPLDTDPKNFKGYKDVERVRISENTYKYMVGRTADYAVVQETAKRVKADFKDAFVVSIVDGKILTVADGLKLMIE